MYVITGAGGRTGRAAALHLLAAGHPVRVVGRSAHRLADLAERGAEVREADQSDAGAMAAALDGADAAYVALQPNYLPDHPDFAGFQDTASAALTEALALSGVPRVVALSSWGAQHPAGTGPVAGLHRFEQRLSALPRARVLSLRPGWFMENLLDHADSVRTDRRITAPFSPDVPLPLITTGDVGEAAAAALVQGWDGVRVRELRGPEDVTMAGMARAVGDALGEPVHYEQCGLAEFHAGLLAAGVAPNVAAMMTEVPEAVNSGRLRMVEPRTAAGTTPTSPAVFLAEVFLPALEARGDRAARQG
ncbi:NmrA family NAD(P)-binding protein [Streptomyces cacaoi]